MKKLLDLFSSSWQNFWIKLVKARLQTWKAPRGCELRGFLVGITPRSQGYHRRQSPTKRGLIVRGVLDVSVSEELGQNYARKTRQPTRPVNAIPVWRKIWTDADRSPWSRRAEA